MTTRNRVGLIVNPVAGIGGRVGLKGSDGFEVQEQALALGAVPEAGNRAVKALACLKPVLDLEVITWAGSMGEEAVHATGLTPVVIGAPESAETTADDTRTAATEMRELGIDLLLFAGGDGTARDICDAIGAGLPALGIPAGVKIHSAAFATNPLNAGNLAALYLSGRVRLLREAEVMDVDEDAFRRGRVSASLFGYLKVPFRSSLVQGPKSASGPNERAAMEAVALAVVESMEQDTLYLLGPGTTNRAIAASLGIDKTLLGVDAVENGELVAADVNESEILELLAEHTGHEDDTGHDVPPIAKAIVTPIGGQGCILGRGNQQLSPAVLRQLGPDGLVVVATPEKINALESQALWVDTGDSELDAALAGHVRVITGYNEEAVCRIEP
jgi:predicted polyphosphate/ATP-dependent NAD kinase